MGGPSIAGFTLKDVRKLLPHIRALQELESGERQPKSALQKHFVSVCRGKAPARTPYETLYLRWRETKPDLQKLEAGLIKCAEQAKQEAREREAIATVESEAKKGRLTPPSQEREVPPPPNPRETKRKRALRKITERARQREILESAEQKKEAPKRYVEEWGSRNDWKRDRASWKRR